MYTSKMMRISLQRNARYLFAVFWMSVKVEKENSSIINGLVY